MSRRSGASGLALTVIGALLACRQEPGRTLTVRHLGDPRAFAHCPARFDGETRPATPCARPVPVARAKDVAVPGGGVLAVPLDPRDVPAGPVQLSVEAYTYGEVGGDAIARNSIDALDDVVSSRRSDRLLEAALAHLPALRAVPRQVVWAPELPATLALRVPPDAAGAHLVYVVWAWPVPPEERRRITLENVAVPPGAALSLGFAVAEPGWAEAAAPVLFTASLSEPGGEVVLWNRTLDPAVNHGDRGWQTVEVDLAAAAGRTVGLTLAASVQPAPGMGSFPLWARPVLLAPAARGADPPPSMLLVSLDTVRADHTSAYGYERLTTPGLARLAADGVLFEQAMSHFPSTTASHMSMLTSLQPCAHGVTLPSGRLSPAATTLAEALAGAGYATAAVTEDALIKGDAGFERGFDSYRDLLWTENEAAALQRGPRPTTGLFGQGLALAADWIARHADRPFFFFLHTYQPHVPFKVPAHYATLFPTGAGAPEIRRKAAEYDAGLRNTDDLLANFLATLARRGLLERTLVVVTSDHGLELGERGGFGHARGVHDEQVHVPLVFRHPVLARGGRRVPGVVPLLDLAPTLLELAGATAPASFRGRSVARALAGEPLPDAGRRVFAEQLWGARQTLLRHDRWAWIQRADGIHLYDMAADPGQQHDLAGAEPERAADGAARIEAFRAACETDARAFRTGAAPAPIDPERQRALRLLGYAE